jgi:hypothetical protein
MNKHVSLDGKLGALQTSDAYRKWYSLDDRRFCILCEKVIRGRMVDVRENGKGAYWLHCPTPGCSGSPRDWFYHGSTHSIRPKVIKSRGPILGFGYSSASPA